MPGTLRPAQPVLRPRWFLGVSLLLLLAACGQVPVETVRPALPPAAAVVLRTAPETAASEPCGSLWVEGQEITLRGLYRTTGKRGYLDVARPTPDGLRCWARFFLDRDIGLGPVDWAQPVYVEAVGRVASGHWDSPGLWDLQVARWTVLPLDMAAAHSSCRAAVAAQTAALQEVDWAALSSPAFVTGTAGFRPDAAALSNVAVQPAGADDRGPLLLLTARGPELPAVRPLVTRWVELECVYDLDRAQAVTLTATIRGEVQE